jgi:hypothetical protein
MAEMVAMQCGECGIEFHAPKHWNDQKRRDHSRWYCPNGHCRIYSAENAEEKLRRERDNLRQQMARVEEEKADAEHKLAQAVATTKRIKKRAAAGNCPCCKRTFANMARHMKHQHPDFVKEGGAKVVPIKVPA